jgi:prophage maintenance system killer protein
LIAMLTFLEVNGIGIDAPDPELADWIISLSAGATPEDLASRVREASRPLG